MTNPRSSSPPRRIERTFGFVDLEGFTYLRHEGQGVLLGIYETTPKHWNVEGAPWDYGMELLPEEIERISPELLIGFARFPTLERAGIRKWVNGAFTFTSLSK